jgi:Rho-type GTPase-activating protein 1/2
MTRRRKKTARNAAQRQKQMPANNSSHLDKSLPSLPPSQALKHAFTPSVDSPSADRFSGTTLAETPSLARQIEEMRQADRQEGSLGVQNYNRGMKTP